MHEKFDKDPPFIVLANAESLSETCSPIFLFILHPQFRAILLSMPIILSKEHTGKIESLHPPYKRHKFTAFNISRKIKESSNLMRTT